MGKFYEKQHIGGHYQIALLDGGSVDYADHPTWEGIDAFSTSSGIVVLTSDQEVNILLYDGDENIDERKVLEGELEVTDGLDVGSGTSCTIERVDWHNGTAHFCVYVNADKSEEVTEVAFVLKAENSSSM